MSSRRRAGRATGEPPRVSGDPTRPGLAVGSPAGGGLAPRGPLLLQPPPPPPGLPLLLRPRLSGPRAPARPPVSARPSVRPPALLALLRPDPLSRPRTSIPRFQPPVARPTPAPTHTPGPAATATLGRGLAAHVGRAAADGAGIKGRQRVQPVAARPAPDPAGGLEQVSGGAPGSASGGHSRARRTLLPIGPAAPPILWPDPAASELLGGPVQPRSAAASRAWPAAPGPSSCPVTHGARGRVAAAWPFLARADSGQPSWADGQCGPGSHRLSFGFPREEGGRGWGAGGGLHGLPYPLRSEQRGLLAAPSWRWAVELGAP